MLVTRILKIRYHADVARFMGADFKQNCQSQAFGYTLSFFDLDQPESSPYMFRRWKLLLTLCKNLHSRKKKSTRSKTVEPVDSKHSVNRNLRCTILCGFSHIAQSIRHRRPKPADITRSIDCLCFRTNLGTLLGNVGSRAWSRSSLGLASQ